jgi:hypothetical protein
MIVIIGAMIIYGIVAIAILREPGYESESGGAAYPNQTGSGAYHQ